MTIGVGLRQIPRPNKRDITKQILVHLKARAKKGPKEPALDGYIDELEDVATALETHVEGNVVADAQRAARLTRLDIADDDVDTWYRHVESFVYIEGHRRHGAHVALALALHGAAFPDGLAHVDDPVPDENRQCRESLSVLRSKDHGPTVTAIGLPAAWLTAWEKALDESEAAFAEVEKAKKAKQAHVDKGRDAETDFVELMVRLRRYVGSRAKKSETERVAEGRDLLAPLLDFLRQKSATAASRATRRKHEPPAEDVQPPAPAPAKPA